MSRSIMMLFAGVAAIGTIVGCGGDDESITTSSLSKAQFVKRANATCKETNEKTLKEAAPSLERFRSNGLSELDAVFRTIKKVVLPEREAQIVAIRELGAPAGDEDEVEAALSAQEEAIEELKSQEKLDEGEDPTRHFSDATTKLEDYGLDECIFSL